MITQEPIDLLQLHRIASQRCVNPVEDKRYAGSNTNPGALFYKALGLDRRFLQDRMPVSQILLESEARGVAYGAIETRHARGEYGKVVYHRETGALVSVQANTDRIAPQQIRWHDQKVSEVLIGLMMERATGDLSSLLDCMAEYDQNLIQMRLFPSLNTRAQYLTVWYYLCRSYSDIRYLAHTITDLQEGTNDSIKVDSSRWSVETELRGPDSEDAPLLGFEEPFNPLDGLTRMDEVTYNKPLVIPVDQAAEPTMRAMAIPPRIPLQRLVMNVLVPYIGYDKATNKRQGDYVGMDTFYLFDTVLPMVVQ